MNNIYRNYMCGELNIKNVGEEVKNADKAIYEADEFEFWSVPMDVLSKNEGEVQTIVGTYDDCYFFSHNEPLYRLEPLYYWLPESALMPAFISEETIPDVSIEDFLSIIK